MLAEPRFISGNTGIHGMAEATTKDLRGDDNHITQENLNPVPPYSKYVAIRDFPGKNQGLKILAEVNIFTTQVRLRMICHSV